MLLNISASVSSSESVFWAIQECKTLQFILHPLSYLLILSHVLILFLKDLLKKYLQSENIGLAKKFGCFCNILQKHPNEHFGQLNTIIYAYDVCLNGIMVS